MPAVPRTALRIAAAASAVVAMLGPATALWAAGPGDSPLRYQRPPDPIPALLAAEAPPIVMVSPRRDSIALLRRVSAPPIAELARPALGLAGLSVDPLNNGPARASGSEGLSFIDLASGDERRVDLPPDARIIAPVWSPDGGSLAFLMLRPDEVELWVATSADGSARRVVGGVNAAFPRAYAWLPDSDGFLVRRVVDERGPPPRTDAASAAPVAQESEPGRAAPLSTVQNLLSGPADEALFEYYFTASLTRVGLDGASPETLGPPGLIVDSLPSPDGRYILETRLKRPFSYSVGASFFPTTVVVRDRQGEVVRHIVERPLQELAASDVPPGPRSIQWREDAPATLVWAEQQAAESFDDRLLALAAPFASQPLTLLDAPGRIGRIYWGRDDLALVASTSADRRPRRTLINPSRPGESRELPQGAVVEPLLRTDASGRERLHLTPDGDGLLIQSGDRVLRVDLQTGEREPHWRPPTEDGGSLVALLDDDGERLLVRRQVGQAPPNLFIVDRSGETPRPVTAFADPAPWFSGVQQRVLNYSRSDGLPLSATLYLPPNHREGVDPPLPLLLTGYPVTARTRAAVRPARRTEVGFIRPDGFGDIEMYLLTQGYAVMRIDMPVVAEVETGMLEGHVPQVVANAAAALDAAAATGLVDRDRAAVLGWSFGASMAANLLAHSDLFQAGIALSGAYNRTLTPFGFQSEERNFWQAGDIYATMSPFNHADKIKDALLMIHGEQDNNSGTFPIQSERMFAAVKGLGGNARLVMLPNESHGYRARESIMTMLAESNDWLEKYVKNAKPAEAAAKK